MRKYLFSAVTAAAVLSATVPSFSMGGGGGGGGGGGYGSYGGSGSSTTTSDYSQALRLIKHQQYAQAIPHLESALADKPNNADILNYLGFTHRMVGQDMTGDAKAGEFKLSLNYYQRALAIDVNHKGVHEYLGELYLQMGDQASAANELKTLETLCPSGCDERDMLTKAIAAYVPPAAPAPKT
jgi:tetratricopeptide (TPR) repeat protein